MHDIIHGEAFGRSGLGRARRIRVFLLSLTSALFFGSALLLMIHVGRLMGAGGSADVTSSSQENTSPPYGGMSPQRPGCGCIERGYLRAKGEMYWLRSEYFECAPSAKCVMRTAGGTRCMAADHRRTIPDWLRTTPVIHKFDGDCVENADSDSFD